MIFSLDNDVEISTNWLFERMEDESLDQPLPKKLKGTGENIKVSPENVMTVASMGFSEAQAKKALQKSVIY